MHRIPAFLRSAKSSPSDEKTAFNNHVNSPSSTFNNVSSHQFDIAHVHPSTRTLASSSRAPLSHIAHSTMPLSTNFQSTSLTGRMSWHLSPMHSRSTDVGISTPRYVLFGNQGAFEKKTHTLSGFLLRRPNSFIKGSLDCSIPSTTPIVHILIRVFDWKLDVDG
jgi:hypothetical protein